MSDETWISETIRELGRGGGPTVQTGPFGSQLHADDYVEDGVPFILIRNIGDGGLRSDNLPRISEADAKRLARYSLKGGDIVFSRVGRIGSCLLISANEAGWIISGQTLRLRLQNPDIDERYLLNCLRSHAVQNFVSLASVGTTRESLNTKILLSIPVRHPVSKKEQSRIAEILGTVDEAIEAAEALIAKQRQVKAGLMHDLFTRGLTPAGHLRPTRSEAPKLYQESPLGWIPREWSAQPFASAMSFSFLGTAVRGVRDATETVPLIKMGNLTWGELNLANVERLASLLVTDERHWLRSGDFLFNTRNTPELVGKTAVYRGEFEHCTYDNNLLCVRFKGGLDSRFVCQYMSHGRGQQRVFAMATGTTSVAAIYWSALSKFLLPVPKVPAETSAIADRVDALREGLAAETANLDKLRQMKQGLMQDLLTGRVPVPA